MNNISKKTTVRLVYDNQTSNEYDGTYKSGLSTSLQTEYALAAVEALVGINAPQELIKAANEKLRSGIAPKIVREKIESIILRHEGEISRTHKKVYDFDAILEEIQQIGEDSKPAKLTFYNKIEEVQLSGMYISEILKDETENILRPRQITIVDAKTGMGKTTFFAEHLLKTVKDSGKKALLLSNRVCLNKASKKEICKALDVEYMLDMFSEDAINNKFCQIDNSIYMLSYQQAFSMFYADHVDKTTIDQRSQLTKYGLLEKLPFRVDLLLMDECQWFFSDASFSAISAYLFDKLMKQYSSAAKCFISATISDDMLSEINDFVSNEEMLPAEKLYRMGMRNSYGYELPYEKNKAIHYKVTRNIKPAEHKVFEIDNFFELIPKIVRTANENCRWLIFHDSKDAAKELRDAINKELSGINQLPAAVFVSTESKDSKGVDGKILQELVDKQDFSCLVLIASSVIDSGLSIKSKKLKHMAFPPFAPDTFTQAFGRDRFRQEKKNIYLRRITPKDISKHIGRAMKIIELDSVFKNRDFGKLNSKFSDELSKSILVLPDGTLELNRFSVKYSKSSLEFFTEVKEQLEKDRYYYLRLQCRLMDLPQGCVDTIAESNRQNFVSFLEEYRTAYPEGMSKEIFLQFRKEFKETCLKCLMPVSDSRDDRPWGLDIISRTLEFNGLPYSIEEKRKGAGGKDGMFYYIVKQTDAEV